MARAGEEQVDQPVSERRSLSLTIPCKAEYVALCRLVVGALGVHEALDEELVADFKVVVTEACNCFLGDPDGCVVPDVGESEEGLSDQEEPSGSLCVDFYVSSEAWEIVVFDPDRHRRIPRSSLCDPMSGGGLGLTIIQALVDSMAQTDSDEEGSVIRLVKRLPSRIAAPD